MRLYFDNFIKSGFFIILLALAVNAQTASTKADETDVQERVGKLEAQVSAMQAELEKLYQNRRCLMDSRSMSGGMENKY